jgi:hypothetical protein
LDRVDGSREPGSVRRTDQDVVDRMFRPVRVGLALTKTPCKSRFIDDQDHLHELRPAGDTDPFQFLDEVDACHVLSDQHVVARSQMLTNHRDGQPPSMPASHARVLVPPAERVLDPVHVQGEHHGPLPDEKLGHARLAHSRSPVQQHEHRHTRSLRSDGSLPGHALWVPETPSVQVGRRSSAEPAGRRSGGQGWAIMSRGLTYRRRAGWLELRARGTSAT